MTKYSLLVLVTPPTPFPPKLPTSQTKVIALNWQLKKEGWKGGGGGRVDSWIDTPNHALLGKTGFF